MTRRHEEPYDPTSINEDYIFLNDSPGKTGSKVELPDEMVDLKYFQNKFLQIFVSAANEPWFAPAGLKREQQLKEVPWFPVGPPEEGGGFRCVTPEEAKSCIEAQNRIEKHKVEEKKNEEFKLPSWLQATGDVHGCSLRPTKQLKDPQSRLC